MTLEEYRLAVRARLETIARDDSSVGAAAREILADETFNLLRGPHAGQLERQHRESWSAENSARSALLSADSLDESWAAREQDKLNAKYTRVATGVAGIFRVRR